VTYTELFRAERLPVLQNRTFAARSEALASPTGDVLLVQNQHTGLVFNQAFDASRAVYDETYQNEQACSAVFRQHLDDVQQIIARHLHGRSLIEIGCGKGYFLERLVRAGFTITGMDPAYEGTNPRIMKSHFRKSLGRSAEGIVLRHVLEHIPDPFSFLSEIAAANGGSGTIYIEVPCLDWICDRRAWFDVFYEHVNYFRLRDFSRMFGRMYESGRIFGSQYLFAVADLASLRKPVAGPEDRLQLPEDFLAGVHRAAAHLQSSTGRRNAVWGAGSKGVIFAIYLQRAGFSIDEVIDVNPAKQGRYLPVSGLGVSSPDAAAGRMSDGDNVFVMNSNYLDEIRSASGGRYSYLPVDHDRV
jgi:hypothetical protein